MNQTYNRISCFVEKNPKTIIKIYGISIQSLWFSTRSTYNSSHSSFPNYVFKNLPFFENSLILNNPKSHHHD